MKLKIGFTKVYEVEGEIKALKKEVVAKEKVNKKAKKGKKINKSSTSSKKTKSKKFSQELTEEELSSIENNFSPRTGKAFFKKKNTFGIRARTKK